MTRPRLQRNFLGLALGATALTATALGTTPAQAVFFHIGSGSIDGSLCVGNDCISSEAFGFDTIRLKENNLRINFADTSSTASFPSTDWRLTANDSTNGGNNRFSIEDVDASRVPFTIRGNAPSNALFVASSGNVGLSTGSPAVDLDILSGNTPTVRLQQDGSSGFAPQSWDLAGNEANFFIRDVTNGSALPFRIQPGAPTNAVYIRNNGRIGMGAGTSPDAPLEVRAPTSLFGTGTSALKIATTGTNAQAVIQLDPGDDGVFWNIDANTGNQVLSFTRSGTGATEMILTDAGTLTVTGNLVSGAGGSCSPPNPGCDAVFDRDAYTPPSIEEHAALMWENGHLPAVGPTSDAEPINLTEKTLRILNELEHAHIYIEELHERVSDLEAEIASLKQ